MLLTGYIQTLDNQGYFPSNYSYNWAGFHPPYYLQYVTPTQPKVLCASIDLVEQFVSLGMALGFGALGKGSPLIWPPTEDSRLRQHDVRKHFLGSKKKQLLNTFRLATGYHPAGLGPWGARGGRSKVCYYRGQYMTPTQTKGIPRNYHRFLHFVYFLLCDSPPNG